MEHLIDRRLLFLATSTNLLGGLLGAAMTVVGCITTVKLALNQESLSAPQLGLILLGMPMAYLATRAKLTQSTKNFLKSSEGNTKVLLLPILASLLITLYKKFVLTTPEAFKSYLRTISEGSLIEWGSFLLLISAAILCFLTARLWSSSIPRLVLFSFAFGLFLIGMEEMSWGQMIFNWDIPSEIAKHNIQEESTIHNLWFIHDHSWTIAALVISITLILSISGVWIRRQNSIKINSIANIALPIWPTSSYFLTSALIYWCVIAMKSGIEIQYMHTMEQEIGELFFYAGIFIHSVYLYLLPINRRNSYISS